jgi:hypothetical protein
MLHGRIRGRLGLSCGPDGYGAIEAARIRCDVAGRALIASPNAGALSAYAVFVLRLKITGIGAIASFDSAVV